MTAEQIGSVAHLYRELMAAIRRLKVRGFKDRDRKALRAPRSLEDKGLLESKAETTDNGTEITFKPIE